LNICEEICSILRDRTQSLRELLQAELAAAADAFQLAIDGLVLRIDRDVPPGVVVAEPAVADEARPLPAKGPLAAPSPLWAREPTGPTRIPVAIMDAATDIFFIRKSNDSARRRHRNDFRPS
jgi:hypothetical protein